MLDPRLLRADPQAVAANLARRGVEFDAARYARLEQSRRESQTALEERRAERNRLSRRIGAAKAAGRDGDAERDLERANRLGAELAAGERRLGEVQAELSGWLDTLPNLLDAEVPDGADEAANRELRRWGAPPEFDFAPRDHAALGEGWGLYDGERAAALAGARFAVLRGDLARLHRALGQFMLELHVREHGYQECYVPYLANAASLRGTGQLPKFREDLFAVEDGKYFLIPTAEVPLTGLAGGAILEPGELPRRWVAHTPCFRAEAGAHGADTRGLIRQHQFDKVELVQAVAPEDSDAALAELTGHAEAVLRRLGLPHRTVELCAGDTGFAAARTCDLEAWLPSQGRYRELSSCSNFRDFQARRLQARYRPGAGQAPRLLHTLNGSGLAVGRTLVAVLENFQRADGTVDVPACLAPWMDGRMRLGAAA